MTNQDLQLKANGLSSKTKIDSVYLGGGISKETHINPDTAEIVIMHTWSVMDGECISRDFEVVEVK